MKLLPVARVLPIMLTSYKMGIAITKSPDPVYSSREKHHEALRRFLSPLDYFRYGELPLTWASLGTLNKGQHVLDLSSPKLLAFHLATMNDLHVTATDLLEENLVEWRAIANAMQINEKLTIETADGRDLRYRDASFDHVYSVSVLEHIPDDGDTRTIIELARVLKPGGFLVLTIPCRPKFKEVFVNQDIYERSFDGNRPVFWCRYYDNESLQTRLIQPSGLELIGEQHLYEVVPYWENFSNLRSRTLKRAQMPFWALIAMGTLRISTHFPEFSPLSIAMLHFRKPL